MDPVHLEPFAVYMFTKINPSMDYYSTAAYLISKQGARKLFDKYHSKKFNKFDLKSQVHATADAMIADTGNTYSVPIFTYLTNESTIHASHLELHKKSKTQQYELWKNVALHYNSWEYFAKFQSQ